jgi:hypothetical protein
MSFPLKDLLALYLDDGTNGDSFSRGFGAETLYQFYVCLGVDHPNTGDLTENLVKVYAKHIRAELPTPAAESYLWDTKLFLEFVHSNGAGWCASDWSKYLDPKPEFKMVTSLTWQMRGRRE